ncbi:glucokinase [Granulicatella balaenopterae]|uniref:Glucokinase n=1 Tax=Granulicatella balaenopterae TaxID=137733 RepID=A0A1H9L002_9LACT|nr:ROK family protein [Granulicatella balaenopterae]SER04589.1 glucokinase [Granulicatella balaenopterae]
MSRYYLGIDIGGTAVKLGLVRSNGEITNSGTYSVNFDHYKTPIIDTVLKSLESFIHENTIDLSTIKGIGVSATGQIDVHNGIVAGTAGHINNWVGTPLKDILQETYHLPVLVENDANCAVIGEHWLGDAANYSNVVMLTIGTGVGGGIIINNHLLSGQMGIAGELGHFPLNAHGKPCYCGNIGCYEQYASTTALVADVKETLNNDPHINLEKINGKYIFTQLQKGNPTISVIVEQWIDNIARGIVGLIHIFNPEAIIIGGGVSQQEELFISPLREKILELTMPCFKKNLIITKASLGNNAGLCGAVYPFIKNNS